MALQKSQLRNLVWEETLGNFDLGLTRRLFRNPAKHLRWSSLKKLLMVENRLLSLQRAQS